MRASPLSSLTDSAEPAPQNRSAVGGRGVGVNEPIPEACIPTIVGPVTGEVLRGRPAFGHRITFMHLGHDTVEVGRPGAALRRRQRLF